MLAMTGSFMVVELVVGNLTNSMALVADSFHMMSDVIALVIAYVSIRYLYCYVDTVILILLRVQDEPQGVEQEHVRLGQGGGGGCSGECCLLVCSLLFYSGGGFQEVSCA